MNSLPALMHLHLRLLVSEPSNQKSKLDLDPAEGLTYALPHGEGAWPAARDYHHTLKIETTIDAVVPHVLLTIEAAVITRPYTGGREDTMTRYTLQNHLSPVIDRDAPSLLRRYRESCTEPKPLALELSPAE